MSNSVPEALYARGFTDLVSVIPPGAQLTPSSKIPATHVGKIPGRKLPSGLWAGYDWRRHQATPEEVKQWALSGASIGTRADRFPGVDIDSMDESLSNIVEQAALAKLGPAPIRVGRWPKRLLMYRTDAPFGRMRMHVTRNGQTHLIEVLGQGQQYLIHGIHPATLKPYTWQGDPVKGPTNLTPITREQVVAFYDYLTEILTMLSVDKIEREGDGSLKERTAATDQPGLKAPSIELLRQAVRAIPNNNELFPDREDYIKMGYAIRAAAQDDPEEGFTIFAEWAAKWEGNARHDGNEADVVLQDWRRFRPPFALGWNWIAEQARAFGFNDASVEFEVVDTPAVDGSEQAPTYSDQWLAEQVVVRQRDVLRYVPQRAYFLAWDSARWQPDAELLAEDIVKRELRAIANGVLRRGVTPKEQAEAMKTAHTIASAGRVTAVLSLVKSDRAIAVGVDALDHDDWALNTPGGIVDLKTGKLLPPSQDALCTKITTVPPDFGASAPIWMRFLDEATGGDKELQRYLQRLSGYVLTGSTKEQHLTFIYGPGGNGKSVFLNVLTGILGDYVKVATMDTFTASNNDRHSTDIAMLMGARLVTASETQAGKRWDGQRVKELTGGTPVTARFMRQDNMTYMPTFKLVFTGNHKPEIRDVDKAFRRRIHMVPFTVTPKVVDMELSAKLRDEWPAILAWMIEGCLMWQKEGLNPPAIVVAATEEYFEEEDAIGRWLKERTVEDAQGTVTTQALFNSWREWTNRTGEWTGTMKRLSSALTSRKYERWQDPTTRRLGFRGLRLKTPESIEELL